MIAKVNTQEVSTTVKEIMAEAGITGVEGIVSEMNVDRKRVRIVWNHNDCGDEIAQTFWFDFDQVIVTNNPIPYCSRVQ